MELPMGSMRMRTLMLASLFGAVLLSACSARVTPPTVEIEARGPIDVDVRGRDNFCPPGQRKHGNC